ncbi:hypothetical protein HDU76_005903, partial [Blyttiomyces sp. JEL0837]
MSTFTPLPTLLKSAPRFVNRVLTSLNTINANANTNASTTTTSIASPSLLNLSTLICDHICLRVSTQSEYEHRKRELESSPIAAKLLTECLVGGRPIATYELSEEWAIEIQPSSVLSNNETTTTTNVVWGRFGNASNGTRKIRILELPSPKPGREYPSGWEHVEFAIGQFPISNSSQQDVVYVLNHVIRGEESFETEVEVDKVKASEIASKLQTASRDSVNSFQQCCEEVGLNLDWDLRGMKKGGFNEDLRLDFPAERDNGEEHGDDDDDGAGGAFS